MFYKTWWIWQGRPSKAGAEYPPVCKIGAQTLSPHTGTTRQQGRPRIILHTRHFVTLTMTITKKAPGMYNAHDERLQDEGWRT